MCFTEDECTRFNEFYMLHKLSDAENECFILLMYEGMAFDTCMKTILEARAKSKK